ncbi:Replicase polyprotein 1a [Bienertia sinuspersici]
MDRRSMNHNCVKDRRKLEYVVDVNEFLQFAFRDKIYGIDRSYNPWVSHGESVHQIGNNEEGYIGEDSDNESDEIAYDDMGLFVYDATNAWKSMNTTLDENERSNELGSSSGTSETPVLFQKLMEDMEADLYPRCKTFRRLEFIITLLHIKNTATWTDKSFSLLLNTLHRAFKDGAPNLEEVVAANDDEVRLVRDNVELELVDVDVVLEATTNADMDNESEEEQESEEDDDDELDTNSSDHELDEDLEDLPSFSGDYYNLVATTIDDLILYSKKVVIHRKWNLGNYKGMEANHQQLDQNGQQHQQILEQQQYQDVEQQHNEEQLTQSTKLTYREKRRLEKAELRLKYPNQKRRWPTRGKKYVSRTWNSNSEEKIKINFMDEL